MTEQSSEFVHTAGFARRVQIAALVLSLGMASFPGLALGANILSNPGFESGVLTPWVQAGSGGAVDWFVTNSDAHSGSYSAENEGNLLLEQFFAPVSTSLITEVSFWMRHPDLATAAAIVFRYSDSTMDEFAVVSSNTGWQFFDVTASLDVGKSLVAFGVYGYCCSQPGRTRLDDAMINVSNVPEPGTFALLGLGLAGLGLSRRRRA